MKIGLIGVGQMGRGIATRLLSQGHELILWNRTRSAIDGFQSAGAVIAATAEAALDAEVVITMLADDIAVGSVWVAPQLISRIAPSTVHLNMATVSLALAERLARMHREHDAQYVAAPVFGRPSAAAAGELDIVAAGAPEALARCVPLFEVMGKRWFNLGMNPVHANIVKIARNFVLATIIESLGEAFALVQKSGVSSAEFLSIITSTSMNAPAYRNYGRLMIEAPAEVTFPLKLGMKDVELALEAAAGVGVPLPTAALIRDQHRAAIANGYGEKDWASLGNFIVERAGL